MNCDKPFSRKVNQTKKGDKMPPSYILIAEA